MKKNKGFAPLVLVAIIVGILITGGGVYYLSSSNKNIDKKINELKVEEDNFPQEKEAESIKTNNELTTESLLSNKINPVKKEQKGPIKLLSLVNGQELISGSTISVKYEITIDNATGMLIVGGDGGCVEIISDKLKGIYSVECKIQKKLGPISATAGDYLVNKENLENNSIDLEVIAPKNTKPIDIIYGPNDYLFGIVGNDAPYISVSIKYTDGITRDIPFTYLKYSLDDPSLISFVHTEKITNTYAQHYIANKGGETTLHLEYQGLKKDIPVKACSMTGNDYPC